jgi:hypothetical protein
MKITAETFYPLIIDFLCSSVGEDEAKSLAKALEVENLSVEDDPLVKAGGLTALLKNFLKQNPDVKKRLEKKDVPKPNAPEK